MNKLAIFHLISFCLLHVFVCAQQTDTLSINLENVKYPHPVHYLPVHSDGLDFRMAYMDAAPVTASNGRTVLLLHGKNFAGYYWTNVIESLTGKGFRVIVPDQVGFGKSAKPFIHYSFHQLATWTKNILDTLNINKVIVLGHSMGGMLATRFSLMFPERTEKLILENPIGLEDYRTIVPYVNTEQQYQTELKATAESIRKYYQGYFTSWKPQYEQLVQIAAGATLSADFPRLARVSAMTYTMIYEQPVVYEFQNIKVPAILLIGLNDRTIVGKALLSPQQQSLYGRYMILGKETASRIRGAKLIEFANCGHIPHIEQPAEFLRALLDNL
jgi:pimeloyl-ACP methyl ester carboxylesterase